MVSELISDFFANLRWDISITLLLTIGLYLFLMHKRAKKNIELRRKSKKIKEVLVGMDALYSLATSTTIYGGVAAIYYSVSGKLLFNQQFIISQEYMILASGIVLFVLGLLAYKSSLKMIKEGRE